MVFSDCESVYLVLSRFAFIVHIAYNGFNRTNKIGGGIKMPEKLLTTQEVAEQLNVGSGTVLKLARENVLRSIIAGPRIYRFKQEEVDRFIRESMGTEYNVIEKEQ